MLGTTNVETNGDSDDLVQQDDDGTFVLLEYFNNDFERDSYTIVNDATQENNLPYHENAEHELELSRDIGELLYGDDEYNADDDNGDLLSYHPRKREIGIKANASSDLQAQDLIKTEINVTEEEPDELVHDYVDDDEVQHDDQISADQNSFQYNHKNKDTSVKKDTKTNHRPKQNRTGVLWKGWPVETRRSNTHWWRKSRQCLEVDNICRTRRSNTWFYYEPKSQQPNQQLFQPSFQLRCEPYSYDRGLIAEERVNLTITTSSRAEGVTFIDDHTFQFSSISSHSNQHGVCKISSTPTHVTLQSMFNFMIGEFYSRTLLPLYRLMISNDAGTTDEGFKPSDQDIQFYVHLSHGNQTLYDGHKLLLRSMLSRRNSPDIKSIVDLFITNYTEDETTEDDCECFEKIVFCGYDVFMTKATTEENDHRNPRKDAPNHLTSNLDTKYTLWPTSQTADDLEREGYCDKGEIGTDLYSCDDWANLRYFLGSNFMKLYPSLKNNTIDFRRKALINAKLISDSYTGDTKEWKIVGLTQRSYRRSWINLPEIEDQCNSLYHSENTKKVACIEVNVEKTTSYFEQLLLHQSVDVLVGVHGAQLTQAVLLPPHGHVLELLPWVPPYIRGQWVQTRSKPTPLGIIFHNTDLFHLGYSLGRDSVPLCESVGSDEEERCFLSKKNKWQFYWDSRDFIVRPDIILQYIENFVLSPDNQCVNMSKALDEGFIQYNIWCQIEGADNDRISPFNPQLKLRHYYDNEKETKGKGKKRQVLY